MSSSSVVSTNNSETLKSSLWLQRTILYLYLLYLALLGTWVMIEAQASGYRALPIIFLQWTPLLIFAPSVWTSNRKGLVYFSFVLLLYFCFSVTNGFDPEARTFAIVESSVAIALFSAIVYYIRLYPVIPAKDTYS
ncbi:MAG: DUF2069 domain-containing protein [Pseudomonadota bacterium]